MNIIVVFVVFVGLVLAVAMGYALGTITLLWLLTRKKLFDKFMKLIVDLCNKMDMIGYEID